jgi:predicted metal-dependent enzyme (double-stranded beta helix superfamily)
MENVFAAVIDRCNDALDTPDPQSTVEAILLEAAKDPAISDAIAQRTKFADLADLVIHRSERLTLLAGALPAGFVAGPHNHNLWSVVGVCAGQEDNEFFVREGDGLKASGSTSVIGPGVLANDRDVIHAICNPLDAPLLVLHAYGGDLFATPRSNWDAETHEEVPFDWKRVRSESDDEA